MRKLDPGAVISVVAPIYNEAGGLQTFVRELEDQLTAMGYARHYELVLVNDGSTDGSDRELDRMAGQPAGRIRVIHLARNFGHTAAVTAGLKHARGQVIILMDADLQDDPAGFGVFMQKWQEGYDVVYSQRASRPENIVLRLFFWMFYRILMLMSDTPIPLDAGNYALMDRRVVDSLLALPESNVYLPGLRAWLGFRQVGIPLARRARYDRSARTGLKGKWDLATNAIFSFSYLPLFIFRLLGVLALTVSLGLAAFTLYHKFITGLAIAAWASNIITATFFGGLNLFGIGIIGEYISRIYNEVRRRPPYIVDRINSSAGPEASAPPPEQGT